MKVRKNKVIISSFFLLIISFVFSPSIGLSYNKSWDQGHQVVETSPGSGLWGRYDYDGKWQGNYTTKECCERLCKMCPVYAKTGQIQETFTDLIVLGVGPALAVRRTYKSQEWASSLLGYGWTFNFGRRLIIGRNNDNERIIGVRLETGEKNFYKETGGTLVRLTDYGATYQLVANSDNTYTINNLDGSRFEIRGDGKIARSVDQNGKELVFQYNSVGCLSRITNASGNYVDFQLGPNGKIASVSDNLGRTISYNYDTNGNLISSTDPLGNTTQYAYNSNNLLAQTTDARGNTIETVQYDTNQPPRVSSFTEKGETFTISYFGDRTEKSDSSGNKWTYYFNDVGIIEKVVDPLGNVKNQSHNKVTSTSLDWEEDLNGNRTTYTYDSDGNVSSKTDPLGNTTTYTYVSGTDWLKTETDPLGRVTSYGYDSNGNNTSMTDPLGNTTSYSYDANGNQTSMTDPLGNTTSYSYDANGNLTQVTDPLGNTTTYTFDSRGNILTETDANGNTTTYAYDLMDRLVSITDALGSKTSVTYDANGNIISLTDANGNSTTFTYDTYNRLIKKTDPLGNTTFYTYDWRDNLTNMTDPNGKATTYIYNIINQLTAKTNALGNNTSFTYDGNGNRLTITDANGNITTNTYDAINRLTKTTYPDGTIEIFSYNADGNLIAKTDRNGKTINYIYDGLNRITAKTYPDGSTTNFSYDLNGNTIAASNSDVSYSFTYDSLHRVTQVTNSTIGKSVSYSYLCCGLKSSMTDPEGGVTNYDYDALKRLTRLTNPLGETTTYTYDNLSRIIRKKLANGNYTTYDYDSINRHLSLVNNTSSASVISSYSYTYDNTFNRTSMTTLTGSHNYSYDPTYQLTQATHPASSTENYTYGPVHNRLTSTGHSNWTYNNTNELVSYNSTTFNYDANGNTISKTDASGTSDYQSDYENRLKRIDNPDGTYSEYHYDPFGNRIKKDVNGLVTWFVYDLMKKLPDVITEYDNSGSLLSSYTHGPGIDEVISMRRGGSSYFYLKDGLGSTTSLSDNTEILVNTYEYDAFGNVISKTETVSNPYGYTGRSFDSESGLMYYRARYYDPITGRFITVDPIGFNGGINSYIYVANNPINLVDPDGEVAVVAAIAACMAAAPCRALVGCVVGAIGSDVMGTIEDLIFRKFDLCKTLGCGAICGCVFGAITAGVAGPDATIIGIIFGKTIKDLLIGQLKGRSCGFACSETVCKDEECEKIDGKDPRL